MSFANKSAIAVFDVVPTVAKLKASNLFESLFHSFAAEEKKAMLF